MVSGPNATDKTPMYEMPLNFVYGVRGLGKAFFVLGFLIICVLTRDRLPSFMVLEFLSDTKTTHFPKYIRATIMVHNMQTFPYQPRPLYERSL